MSVMCWGLLAVPCVSLAQAITQPDIKGFFVFERFGEAVPLGINVVRQLDDVLLLGANREFIRSADSGRSWSPVLTPLQHKNITSLLAHGNAIIVGTATGGVYRTNDHGLYWERFGNEPRLRKTKALLRTTRGYIASNDSGACFARSDTDTAWHVLALPSPCRDFVMFDDKPWFVCDNGVVLYDDGDGPKPKRSLGNVDRAALVVVDDQLVVVLDTSVIVLDDDADSLATWRLPIANWTACVALNDQLLVGGRSTGLRKLNVETGETTFVFAGPAEAENISALATSGDSIVIGTSRSNGRCYVVTERSRQWHALNPSWMDGTFDVTDLTCLNGIAYIGTREEGVHAGLVSDAAVFPIHDAYQQTIFTHLIPWREEMLVVARRAGIFRMTSGAGRLEWFTRTLPQSFEYFATAIGSRILAGLNGGRTLWSDNGGKTWTQSADSLPAINDMNTIGEVVYASTFKGLYRSDDKGETWHIVEGPWQQSNILWVTGTTDTLFITSTSATYRHMKGRGIKKLEAEFTPGMTTIFTSVVMRDGLLLATGAPALYVSTDVGDTWHRKLFDGANAVVSQFFYKGYYYIFTDRGALWRSPTP